MKKHMGGLLDTEYKVYELICSWFCFFCGFKIILKYNKNDAILIFFSFTSTFLVKVAEEV